MEMAFLLCFIVAAVLFGLFHQGKQRTKGENIYVGIVLTIGATVLMLKSMDVFEFDILQQVLSVFQSYNLIPIV